MTHSPDRNFWQNRLYFMTLMSCVGVQGKLVEDLFGLG